MICDRVWRNCFFKHIDLPDKWRSADADLVRPSRQDVFWVECSVEEVKNIIIPLIRDDLHRMVVECAFDKADRELRGLHFLTTRWGTYVQFYPFMVFNVP